MIHITSYNIDCGVGIDLQFNLMRSLHALKSLSADIISLQEVPIDHPDYPSHDYPSEAEKYLQCNGCFGRTFHFRNGGKFGNLLLSHYPLELIENFPLPVPREIEPRSALITKIKAKKIFYMIALHFPFQGECENDNELRLQLMTELQQHIVEKQYFPVILAGDLNNNETSPVLEFIRKSWDIANDCSDALPTAKTRKFGWMQIDYICSYPKGAFSCKYFKREDEYGASDHYPVTAGFEYNY